MLINIFSKIITIFKGEEYKVDSRIPKSYMIKLTLSKFIALIRGFIIFRKVSKRVFVSHNVKIKCSSKIKFSGGINIDRGVYLDALSLEGVSFGNNVSIGKYTTIECTGSLKDMGKGLKVGNNVGMGSHGFWGCAGGVKVGNDTIFGNFVSVHSENHNYTDILTPIRLQGINRKGITIGNNCWIGAKVTILDGVDIEDGCIIAAGALLTEGIYKKNCIYGGIPARLLKLR